MFECVSIDKRIEEQEIEEAERVEDILKLWQVINAANLDEEQERILFKFLNEEKLTKKEGVIFGHIVKKLKDTAKRLAAGVQEYKNKREKDGAIWRHPFLVKKCDII